MLKTKVQQSFKLKKKLNRESSSWTVAYRPIWVNKVAEYILNTFKHSLKMLGWGSQNHHRICHKTYFMIIL